MSSQMLNTPIGLLTITAALEHIVSIRMAGAQAALAVEHEPEEDDGATPLLGEAAAQITAWFDGRLRDFDLPLAPSRSPRGEELRAAISEIPYGNTMSYGEVARRAVSGPHAIGQACRRNPYPIVVPCHRVIGASQSIGHYSGGDGVVTKQWLIEHERRNQTGAN